VDVSSARRVIEMPSQSISWLLTAGIVICTCVWPIKQGLEMLRYGIVAGSNPAAAAPWFDTPGLASTAREAALTPIDDSSDDQTIRKLRGELEELLAIRPLSSISWLQLAETRVDANDSLAKVMEALELSILTAPNEGYIRTRRGMFGVWQWERLSPEAQSRSIVDLTSERLTDPTLDWLKATLAKKSDEGRTEIGQALRRQGVPLQELGRMGL
jgi:hypothetical protein